ncbi:heavy-metal-associated domain-containing protein [Thermus thermamylovorans]|uniref:Heavy-metal-associated domain-containing protein n=1 Tax=Thermus thermamylovorans TaxID=2509362 RepID=A0A4Q9AYL3_9DEIN|nr:heavy metal-associated domain-containing protein [Thermus thermamylovorans]TBH16523.1 heavy-metal-associated domain-containing protein [Thermus thermamylovorans]
MNRVMIGIRGEPTPEGMARILSALRRLEGVQSAQTTGPAQLLVEYDPQALTVMDLIRTIREEGFLAGML